ALGADADALVDQIPMHTWAPVPPPALLERRANQHTQPTVVHCMLRLRPLLVGVEPAERDVHRPADPLDRKLRLHRLDPGEDHSWCLAKKAVAFFKMSRSMRSSRTSFRKCASSARSSLVRPVRPFVRSACSRATQWPNAEAVRSSSRATAPTVFPSSRTSRTAPALISVVNRWRARRAPLSVLMLDILSPSQKMSTKMGEAQLSR